MITTSQPLRGLHALPLIHRRPRLLPVLERSMSAVDPALVELFRQLAVGAAPWPLFLFGPAGSGKTLASLCLADVVRTAVYLTAEGLCDLLMQGQRDEIRELWATIEEKDLLIVDELGARSQVGDLAYSSLRRVLDTREQNCGRVAIYISNLPPREIAGLFDDRIASRLLCGSRFELRGCDRRFGQ